MKLNCPKCQTVMPPFTTHRDGMVATCPICQTTVILGDRLASGRVEAIVEMVNRSKPDRLWVQWENDALTISWRWFMPRIIPVTLLAMIVTGCAGWATWTLFSYSGRVGDSLARFTFVLPLVGFCLGLGLLYAVLAEYVNSTDLRIDHTTLTIRHYPLPLRANRELSLTRMTHLYIRPGFSKWSRRWTDYYDVYAVFTETDEHERILAGIEGWQHARFVEQAIETYLGTEDRRVPGEYGRT
jgi:hypothetical protein